MTYATQTHLTDRYGADVLLELADRDGDNVVDTAIVDRALADADAVIDSYLARRYDLPLASTPAVLTTYAAQIAFYYLQRDRPTEEARADYKDALAWLGDVGAGRAELDIAGSEPATSADGLETSGPDRIFSRTTMEGF